MVVKNFKKLISIVVVSLNTKKEFLKTIKSIKKQDYKNYQIIIVDGKSTDGTVDEIKKLNSKKIKYIIEKDKGIYDAMNKGSQLASGDWIIFLNSGDIFFNNHVLSSIFNKYLEKIDIIIGNTIVKNGGIKYSLKSKYFTSKTILMPFCHQSTFVNTDIIKRNKFSLKYKYSSDFEFFLKCFSTKKIFYDTNLTIATVSSQGSSDSNRQKVYSENIMILSKYNYSFFIIVKLWFLKLFNFKKDFIKYILPKDIILLILKFKYIKSLK